MIDVVDTKDSPLYFDFNDCRENTVFWEVKIESKGTKKRKTTRAHGKFPCERCGRSYIRKDSLRRHLQWECGKEPTFQCPYCSQRCKRKAHHIRHIRRQHSDMIDFVNVEVKSEITDVTNG
ncbi:hypothetical protein B7P43_G11946 [Cryptotermes secundus]|uniref:C2H2-type domain-containing protein n=1 Tax=Cryptotermes secundus TaxID=105785 RepID=A0A2J7R9V5_9NEOP|nr:hypothetical protein B7P43_G11946 [Cryptotermes secundus]